MDVEKLCRECAYCKTDFDMHVHVFGHMREHYNLEADCYRQRKDFMWAILTNVRKHTRPLENVELHKIQQKYIDRLEGLCTQFVNSEDCFDDAYDVLEEHINDLFESLENDIQDVIHANAQRLAIEEVATNKLVESEQFKNFKDEFQKHPDIVSMHIRLKENKTKIAVIDLFIDTIDTINNVPNIEPLISMICDQVNNVCDGTQAFDKEFLTKTLAKINGKDKETQLSILKGIKKSLENKESIRTKADADGVTAIVDLLCKALDDADSIDLFKMLFGVIMQPMIGVMPMDVFVEISTKCSNFIESGDCSEENKAKLVSDLREYLKEIIPSPEELTKNFILDSFLKGKAKIVIEDEND